MLLAEMTPSTISTDDGVDGQVTLAFAFPVSTTIEETGLGKVTMGASLSAVKKRKQSYSKLDLRKHI